MVVEQSFSHSTPPHLPRSLKVKELGSSTAGTVESATRIFLPYNFMVNNKSVFFIQLELYRKKGMKWFLTSKVAIAQKSWDLSTGGRWFVISFKKEHYLPLIMLMLC